MKYEYRIEDHHAEDEWFSVGADDEEHAAEKAAEEYYDEEPSDPYSFNIVIYVRKFECTEAVKINVTADTKVRFFGRVLA